MDEMNYGTRFLRLLAGGAMLVLATSSVAQAQQVVVMVNGDPITAYDIEQRTKLIQISGGKNSSRQQVIEELIEEKIKHHLVRRYSGLDSVDTEVENAVANIAKRSRVTPQQFAQQLQTQGIGIGTLKSRLKAELIWSQIVRGKFQQSMQIRDKDVLAALETRKKDDKAAASVDYTLRPILFVVPRGSPASLVENRQREAESLRGRFNGCDEGIRVARSMRDVAVRQPVVRNSADLPAPLRALLDKTEVGKLTNPEVTQQGIEVFALCAKKAGTEDTAGKREVRDEMMNERFQENSKKYMKELRSQAMIEFR
jgi:peptidyl-prolyl cis-trans isomerase SurA